MNRIKLLNEFREQRSESAFGELVRLYTNLVYSAAVRRLGSESLAQEAAQCVFIRLAKSAPHLATDAELTAWLHRTTVHVSIDLWRSEVRRHAREEHAAAMQLNSNDDPTWKEIAPALDEALNELNESDRKTILLRFFDEKPMRDLGVAIGVSEDAAKMRVSRALERLRDQLSARGVTCSAVALGAYLSEGSVKAAPAAVAAALSAFHYPLAAGAGAGAAGASSLIGAGGMAKMAGGVVALALVGLTTWLVSHRSPTENLARAKVAAAILSAGSAAPGTASTGAREGTVSPDSHWPDPVKLLQAVARARQRIGSGEIEFQVETIEMTRSVTNQIRISASFDATRRRFEQFGREYAYSYDPDPARAQEIVTKADAFGPDRDGAMAAGLLSAFEAHTVTIHDGSTLLRYRESDGKPQGATIENAEKGSVTFVFDPRCLGLATSLHPGSTIERCLRPGSTNAVELLGKETVDGTDCWHLRVASSQLLELWLDVAHPIQVVKVLSGSQVLTAKYDTSVPGSLLPLEVTTTVFQNGAPAYGTRMVRTASRFNITVDPATFTLAGLGMKVGTDVVDVRILRSIGYWTGTGLSEKLPRKTKPTPEEQPNLEELLTILETDPASLSALDAATWILLNTPDGPAVEKAAAVLLREHVRSPELASLCQQLERVRPRCAVELLEAILKENPQSNVRAVACFTLATLRKDACNYGADKKMTAEAERLFERVITEFSDAGRTGRDLAGKAKPELSELRRLTIGKAAPELEGTDLQGNRIKLSEHRGKVVVLTFWTASTVDGPEEQRRLLAPFAGRPIVWIAINCDNDEARAVAAIEKHQISWPVIWDNQLGPISTEWNVRSWPTVFVIDADGVIRSRAARGKALVDAVAGLLSGESLSAASLGR